MSKDRQERGRDDGAMVAARATGRAARPARAAWADACCGPRLFCGARFCRGRHAGAAGEPRPRPAFVGVCEDVARPARWSTDPTLSPHLARICDEEAPR